ncbi:MAG: hypothetical protein OXF48_08960, partial [Bacteroidetes bacterium]|nr:hypothetical protein [Bacteroidota bacterium]
LPCSGCPIPRISGAAGCGGACAATGVSDGEVWQCQRASCTSDLLLGRSCHPSSGDSRDLPSYSRTGGREFFVEVCERRNPRPCNPARPRGCD